MTPEERSQLTTDLKQQAFDLGFRLMGVTHAVTPSRLAHFHQWLAAGFAGEMSYLERRKQAYEHPSSILDGCKSLLMLGVPYLADNRQRQVSTVAPGEGKIARYAQAGSDYHLRIRQQLKQLKRWLIARQPQAKVRGIVDTAPLHEREFAQRAGLGWIGKNTLLLNKQWGSYFFLAALLTDLDLVADEPHFASHCGSCTACLDACPTDAFVQPFVMDATRCLSYVTIESQTLPSPKISGQMSDWLFGCDICQEVCPWNRRSQCNEVEQGQLIHDRLNILRVLDWDEASFEAAYDEAAFSRAGRRGMVRNAALLAGSQKLIAAVESLQKLLSDVEPVIRAAAAWALGQIHDPRSLIALVRAQEAELDSQVKAALAQALCSIVPVRNPKDLPINADVASNGRRD
jgi:epoxyqueuosine reductase